jgi:hypothetical protein
MTDLINSPPHYRTAGGLEAIDVLEQWRLPSCGSNGGETMPKLTMDALIHTVQGCDGYIMDLVECAKHYGVSTDELKRFATEGPPWLIFGKYDDTSEEYIAFDGE